MKRIWKYSIRVDDRPHPVPAGVPVLFDRSPNSSDMSQVAAWFEVSGADDTTQLVQVVGTGHPVHDDWRWLASFVDAGLVWHLYSLPRKESADAGT